MAASLEGGSSRRRIIEDIVSQASPVALQSLRSLGFDYPIESVSRICVDSKDVNICEHK